MTFIIDALAGPAVLKNSA